MPTLYQIVAGFRSGDAISNEALLIRDLCAAHGLASEIVCPLENTVRAAYPFLLDVDAFAKNVKPDDIALLHLSAGGRGNAIFATLPCRKVILYHNITPPEYFARLDPEACRSLREGLRQVAALRDAADSVWADSSFNASELRAMGYRDPKVLPLILDESLGSGEIAGWRRDMLADPPLSNILFVGRLAPNKRQDRLISVFGCYQRYCNPASRLIIAGGNYGSDTYRVLLLGDAYVWAARNVLFTDFMDEANLRACYATASAFVCMSDHEGFCVPLLEAMAWHVPVFAWEEGAVRETLDGAGVLFAQGTPPETMAETIHRVLSDPALRAAVVKKQDERLARFRARDVWAEVRAMLGLPDALTPSPS